MQSSRTYSLPFILFFIGNFTVCFICVCISFLGEHWKFVGKLYVETLFEQNGWKWKGGICRTYIVGTYIALQSSLVRITSSISK